MIVAQRFIAGEKRDVVSESVKRTTEVVDFRVIRQSSVSRTKRLSAADPSSELLGYSHSSANADYQKRLLDKASSALRLSITRQKTTS
jgi:hypothetical protein